MANWNLNFPANTSGYQKAFNSDSTYDTALNSQNENDRSTYFERSVQSQSIGGVSEESYGNMSSWAGAPHLACAGHVPLTQFLPAHYPKVDQSLPLDFSSGYSGHGSTYTNQTALLSGAEMLLIPAKEGDDDEAIDVKEEYAKEPPPKRKRGRPRLKRSEADANKPAAGRRIPHNQVERKYRETLNNEMERLRQNIPGLPHSTGESLMGPPKPSKATVLAAAVQYIKELEAETEALVDENEGLRNGHLSRSDTPSQKEPRRPNDCS